MPVALQAVSDAFCMLFLVTCNLLLRRRYRREREIVLEKRTVINHVKHHSFEVSCPVRFVPCENLPFDPVCCKLFCVSAVLLMCPSFYFVQ